MLISLLLYEYATICLFILLLMVGHLGCFQIWAIMNKTAFNMLIFISFG